jgi:mannose-6-phosphate isomerase-like protein (cupin superfamily)
MRRLRADTAQAKSWMVGAWNSDLPISLGFATEGIDEPHVHARVTEIFLIARGTSTLRVGSESLSLDTGDVIVVDPGEPHTFLSSSEDYLHFVVHTPALSEEGARGERSIVDRSALGLPP